MDMERKGGLKCDECEMRIKNREVFFRKTISVGAFSGRDGTDRRGVFNVCDFLGARVLCKECAKKGGVQKFRGCDHIDGGDAERLRARGTCSVCETPLQGRTGVVVNDEWLVAGRQLLSSQSKESYCRECSHKSELVSKWLLWLNEKVEEERGEDWISTYMAQRKLDAHSGSDKAGIPRLPEEKAVKNCRFELVKIEQRMDELNRELAKCKKPGIRPSEHYGVISQAKARCEVHELKTRKMRILRKLDALMSRKPASPPKPAKKAGKLEGIVLSPETRKNIELLTFHITDRDRILGLGLDDELHPSCPAFNFYGPPGTGKTLAAGRIAKACGYELEVLTASNLLDKYVGVTEKLITRAFKRAREEGHILFFDEADSLIANRVEATGSGDLGHNSQVNTLLKELEKHTMPVFFATNLPMVYDSAFGRRILFSIKFGIPSREQQVELFMMLGPKKLGEDVDYRALSEDGLSGGDIRNIVYNAVGIALMGERDKPTQADFLEARKLLNASKKSMSRKEEEKPVNGRQYA